jgi:hypothetical protein
MGGSSSPEEYHPAVEVFLGGWDKVVREAFEEGVVVCCLRYVLTVEGNW